MQKNLMYIYKSTTITHMNEDLLKEFNGLKKESEFISFIAKNLECPIDCRQGTKLNIIEQELLNLWKEVCSKYSVAKEEDFIRDFYEVESGLFHSEDLEEFERVSQNLIRWIDKAKNEFINTTNVFNTKMASSKEHSKHYLKSQLSEIQLKKLATSKNISFFYSEINETHLEKILVDSFSEYFDLILSNENIRFGVKVEKNIGISKTGLETNWMMFEINKSGRIAHAYPCDEAEIKKISFQPQYFDKVYFDWLREEF